MDTYTKTRKLQQELIDARATDGDLDDAITAAEATAFADITGKPGSLSQFYYQSTAPSHSTVACVESTVSSKDYWIDSDDNKLYRSDGTQWVEIQDFGGDVAAVQALLDDIADDAKITPVEKLTLKPIWDAIVTEATLTTGTLIVQAATFSVADADFDAAYAALYGYIITSLDVFNDMSATTSITRATWDGHWNLYWDERTDLIILIEAAAKSLADAAQGTADTAVSNAATAQAAAEAAQADADTGIANAATAQGLLDDIAADDKITPVEKLTIKPIWDDIVVEGTATTGTIPVQATLFSVADTDFDTAFAALDLYLNTTVTVFGNMATTTTITRATWDAAWEAYYAERTDLLILIANAAKTLADNAQSTADGKTDDTVANTKTQTFYQDAIPTAITGGDQWFDTNDGNKLYRATSAGDDQIGGGEWTEVDFDLDNITDGSTYGKVAIAGITAGKIVAAGIDVANLAAINADMGTITAGSIDAARITSGSISVTYTDADVTADNTAGDTTLVSGTAAATVASGAAAGATASQATGVANNADVTGSNTAADTALVSGLAASRVAGWAHASDTTKIDGGDIYTNTVTATAIAATTITASEIAGAGFGNLTISSGTITLSTTDGITIASGGDIKVQSGGDVVVESGGNITLESGGDLILQPHDSSPAKIIFEDSGAGTYDIYIGRDTTSDKLQIKPTTTETCGFEIGSVDSPVSKFSWMTINVFTQLILQAAEDTYAAAINIIANDASTYSEAKIGAQTNYIKVRSNDIYFNTANFTDISLDRIATASSTVASSGSAISFAAAGYADLIFFRFKCPTNPSTLRLWARLQTGGAGTVTCRLHAHTSYSTPGTRSTGSYAWVDCGSVDCSGFTAGTVYDLAVNAVQNTGTGYIYGAVIFWE